MIMKMSNQAMKMNLNYQMLDPIWNYGQCHQTNLTQMNQQQVQAKQNVKNRRFAMRGSEISHGSNIEKVKMLCWVNYATNWVKVVHGERLDQIILGITPLMLQFDIAYERILSSSLHE